MLGHLELDIKVSDAGIKTVKSNDCKRISRDNGDTNNVLAIIQEGARFFYKDKWKFINLIVQSISRLYLVSQLYPRTKEQEESSRVT